MNVCSVLLKRANFYVDICGCGHVMDFFLFLMIWIHKEMCNDYNIEMSLCICGHKINVGLSFSDQMVGL